MIRGSSEIKFVRGLANSLARLHPALLEARVIDAIERNSARLMAENCVPGFQFALAIADRPARSFCAGVGIADGGSQPSQPVEKETHFRVASLSKPVVAMVAVRAAEKRAVDLDAPVGRLLGDIESLRSHSAEVEGITLRLLLSHASGIADQNMPHVLEGEPIPTLEQALNGALGVEGVPRLERRPGEKTVYSGLNYALLELALKRVTGREFEGLAREYLLEPCGSRCCFSRAARMAGGVAWEHDEQGRVLPHQAPVAIASSGMVGSAVGIAELLREAVESAAGRSTAVFEKGTAQQLFTLQRTVAPISKFALGWHRMRDCSPAVFDHHGHRPGLRCAAHVIPAARVTAVALTNGERGESVIQPVLSMIRGICARSEQA